MKPLRLLRGPAAAVLAGCCLLGCRPPEDTHADIAPQETTNVSHAPAIATDSGHGAPAAARWRRHVDAVAAVADEDFEADGPKIDSAQHISELQEALNATAAPLIQGPDTALAAETQGRIEETGLMPVPWDDPVPAAPGQVAQQHAALDVASAVVAQTEAAEQGDAEAQLEMALRYYNGDGVARDEEQANYWLQKAEESFVRTQPSSPNVIIARSHRPKFAPRKAMGFMEATHTVYVDENGVEGENPATDAPGEFPEFAQGPPPQPIIIGPPRHFFPPPPPRHTAQPTRPAGATISAGALLVESLRPNEVDWHSQIRPIQATQPRE